MLTLHHWNAVAVIVACAAAGVAALAARRWRIRGALVANLIALAQTLVAAQIGMGLLLITADDRHAKEELHYAYGVFALIALLAPFLYAPSDPRARLAWFGVAALVAAALAVRAYMTAG
jgi:hypothetical protein